MNKITGLILTGGGAKAAYQVGAIKALAEIFPTKTCPFQIISGTSAGAINTALLAGSAEDWVNGAENLEKNWSKLQLENVYRTDSFSIIKIALGWISRTLFGGKFLYNAQANYLLDTSPLEQTLSKGVDFAKIKNNIDQGILRAVSFTVVQYFSNDSITFFDGTPEIKPWSRSGRFGQRTDLQVKHVMASSAIPIFFPPVEIDSKYYGDGSLRQVTPLSAAIRLGADRILSIGVRHERKPEEISQTHKIIPPTVPSLAQISGELMNSIFLDSMDTDMERMERVNHSVELMNKTSPGIATLKKVDHLHLRPSQDLQSLIPSSIKKFPWMIRFLFRGLGASKQQGNNLMGYLSFLPECSKPLMELGYEDTMKKKDRLVEFFEKN